MPFPASTGSLSDAIERACRTALQMRDQATTVRNLTAAGNVGSSLILNIEPSLRQFRAELAAVAAMPGIGPYAQAQLGDGGLNVAAEFNAMLSAIDGVVAWIRGNFPVDAQGRLLARRFGANGPEDVQFTPAQTAGLRAQLDALIATVA